MAIADLAWTDLQANAALLGRCPLRVVDFDAGFTLADLQAANVNVLWAGDSADAGQYSNAEIQAVQDFVNAGGGLVSTFLWLLGGDNSPLADWSGVNSVNFTSGTTAAQLPVTVLDPYHPIARDLPLNFNLGTYGLAQAVSLPHIQSLQIESSVIMSSADDSNLLVAYDNGIWRGVFISTYPEYQSGGDMNIQQVMYNSAAWAAGYDNP
jgi:trehalose utilization protein